MVNIWIYVFRHDIDTKFKPDFMRFNFIVSHPTQVFESSQLRGGDAEWKQNSGQANALGIFMNETLMQVASIHPKSVITQSVPP